MNWGVTGVAAGIIVLLAVAGGVVSSRFNSEPSVVITDSDLDGPIIGSRSAPTKILQFGDFQCSYCARLAPNLQAIVDESDGHLSVVFKHLPLTIHPHAYVSALAAECAREWNAFEAVHDRLYEHFSGTDQSPNWEELATDVGIEEDTQFAVCISEARFRERVLDDTRLAKRLGITATPALVVDGEVTLGYLTASQLRRLIWEAP